MPNSEYSDRYTPTRAELVPRPSYAELLEASPEGFAHRDALSHMLEESGDFRPTPDRPSLKAAPPTPELRTRTIPEEGCSTPAAEELHESEYAPPSRKDSYVARLLDSEGEVPSYGAKSDISPEVSLSIQRSDSKELSHIDPVSVPVAAQTLSERPPIPMVNARPVPSEATEPKQYVKYDIPQASCTDPSLIDDRTSGSSERPEDVSDLLRAVEAYGEEDFGRSFKPYPKMPSITTSSIIPSAAMSLYSSLTETQPRGRAYYEAQFQLENPIMAAQKYTAHEDMDQIPEEGAHQAPSSTLMMHYPGHQLPHPSGPHITFDGASGLGGISLTNSSIISTLPGTQGQVQGQGPMDRNYAFAQHSDYFNHPIYDQNTPLKPVPNPFGGPPAKQDGGAKSIDIYRDSNATAPVAATGTKKKKRSSSATAKKNGELSKLSRPSTTRDSLSRAQGSKTHALAVSIVDGKARKRPTSVAKSPQRRAPSARTVSAGSIKSSVTERAGSAKRGRSAKRPASPTRKPRPTSRAGSARSPSRSRKSAKKGEERYTLSELGDLMSLITQEKIVASMKADLAQHLLRHIDADTTTSVDADTSQYEKYRKYPLGAEDSVGAYVPAGNETWPVTPQPKLYAQSAIGGLVAPENPLPPRTAQPIAITVRPAPTSRSHSRSDSRRGSMTPSVAESALEASTDPVVTMSATKQHGRHGSPHTETYVDDALAQNQTDRMRADVRALLREKLSETIARQESSDLSVVPRDLLQLKGAFSKDHEYLHNPITVDAEGKRYRIVGYNVNGKSVPVKN
ncbi:hypothetical protein GMRT_13939 [Giardia muris]|uniref:Uncharacterized protein n=1 Tax=Giardia muris TaxID=5742 RepID=A0A4Z1T0P3_GIAMU|nr:hypothetical protein GMRT_13939 [Giardia muris]|eukprot:TNJ26477.1 hypothetical protein GMRT_13939 [Giardia muris]